MNFKVTKQIRSLVKKALQEDLGPGDITTQTFVPKGLWGEAVITAKEAGVFCGGAVAAEVFRLRDRSLRVRLHVKEGRFVKKGRRVMTLRGRTCSILEAERTALNFLGHLSGIATLTRRYVDKIRGTKAKIYDTRKTTPLWRELEKYAVTCGGGENHRFGLFDEILVKDNHWTALQSLQGDSTVILSPRSGRRIPIEIEVKNLNELATLLENPFVPDRILLDNFSIHELKRAVLFVRGLDYVLRKRYGIHRRTVGARHAVPLLEASGGINLANVRAVAQTGVDRISIGRLTHSAPALDFSLMLVRR